MNATARTARQIVKTRRAQAAAEKRARRAVAANGTQPVRTHLVARGLDDKLADRFAGAVSRKAGAAAATTTKPKKMKGRTVRAVSVKLFTVDQIDAVLAVYRPSKDRAAQRAFHALAA